MCYNVQTLFTSRGKNHTLAWMLEKIFKIKKEFFNMVNLIITLISIALIAIVAVAALYNGGDAFRQGSANASAAQLVNAGQQISAANILYANDHGGTYAEHIDTLTNESAYLSSEPRVPSGFVIQEDITGNVVTITSDSGSIEICEAVNKQGGYDEAVLSGSGAIDKTFGCYGGTDGSAPHTFEFR